MNSDTARKPTAALEAKWRAKLAESGFRDLESRDRDAPLSNVGKLHEIGIDNEIPIVDRIEHGSAYTDWAHEVLRQLNGHDDAAKRRRMIWERHTNGESLKEIGRTHGLNYHIARDTVRAIEEKYRCPGREAPPTANSNDRRRVHSHLRKMVRPISRDALVAMASALLMGQSKRTSPRTQMRS